MGITRQDRMVSEDDIPSMPCLNVMVKETLRKYPPVVVLPVQYADKNVTLGGYDIPKGWQVLIDYFINTTIQCTLLTPNCKVVSRYQVSLIR
jgi:ent-kaurene oxidase